MTDDPITWLRAQLDEDERIARTAAQLQADPEEGWGADGRAVTPHIGVIHEDEARQHVVRFNPARVLAEVDAKRRMLGEHFEGHLGDTGLGSDRCDTCDNYAWPCPTLRLLALPYADRPGYRSEWAP